ENVVISPAALPERERWLAGLNPAWSERYGGGWADVQRLMELSRAARDRRGRNRRLAVAAVSAGVVVVAAFAFYQADQARRFEELAESEKQAKLQAQESALQANESFRKAEAVKLWNPLIAGDDQRWPLLGVALADADRRHRFALVMLEQPEFATRF